MDDDLIIRWMKGVPFFTDFRDDDLSILSRDKKQFLKYETGESIIREGETDQCMYIILKGTVRVTKASASREVELTRMNQGAVFGEVSLLRKGSRTSTVKAETQTVVMSMKPETLDSLSVHLQNKFRDRLLKIVVKRFENLNSKYSELLGGNGFV